MEFKNPWALLLLLAWVPMVWVYLRREKRARAAIRFPDLALVRAPLSPLRVRLRHVLLVLRLLAVGLLVVALARPRKGQTQEEVSTEGVDIMLVLDCSTSMKALDFKPKNRLFVAKQTIASFIAQREHDRMGLVVFAGRAFTKCPLTLDYGILTQLVEDIDFGSFDDDIANSTAIGTATATAASRLLGSTAKSKVMILCTDGANNRGDIAPLTAAKAAAELGIKLYTIGVGREGQVPYPVEVRNPWSGQVQTQVQMIESDLDERTLAEMATATGGKYFRAQNAEELQEIYSQIDKMEKTEIQTMSYTTYSERFFPWLLLGALMLFAEIVMAQTVLRRIP
jgi:Ca-activated chloride channel homolog